ncbi:hypothetical protein [Geminicoccus roseus]|uniref:hypothetical protein n=1 Tax=Geminicoccus roseus TaxID=404900 RepID=UPI000426BB3F|nr:hypothetical protein [Geminicoccus roseus]
MFARIWYGWTCPEQAERYEELLRDEIFPGIRRRSPEGLEHIDLLRREEGGETGFVTIMWFADRAALERFAGVGGEAAYVPAAARAILARFEARSAHYELRHRFS